MRTRVVWFGLVASTALLAGCLGGGSNVPTIPTPGPTCSPPAGTQYALVYPAPSSTNIPDTFGQVVVGASPPLPSSWNAVVAVPALGISAGGNPFVTAATPLPQPTATPTFANPAYQSSTFGTLTFPAQNVQVYLNDSGSNCTPLGPIGSFTTH